MKRKRFSVEQIVAVVKQVDLSDSADGDFEVDVLSAEETVPRS